MGAKAAGPRKSSVARRYARYGRRSPAARRSGCCGNGCGERSWPYSRTRIVAQGHAALAGTCGLSLQIRRLQLGRHSAAMAPYELSRDRSAAHFEQYVHQPRSQHADK
jgi:hypothetical protein